jgi:hypothetical protein
MSLIIKRNTTFKIPRTGSGAPNGIPVASTNTINVVDNFNINQTISLNKISSTEYRTESSPIPLVITQSYCEAYGYDVDITLFRVSVIREFDLVDTWFYRYYTIYECDGQNIVDTQSILRVPQVTNGIIPTTGWTLNGNPYSFNITAA